MKADESIKLAIQSLNYEELKPHIQKMNGTNFGIFMPTYVEDGLVKTMMPGYSQIEKDLVVSISPTSEALPDDVKTVGWFGGANGKDSKCKHGTDCRCRHCTRHQSHCRHCRHKCGDVAPEFIAQKLDYDNEIANFEYIKDSLEHLSNKGIGISLLHAHSDEHMFTELPRGYVSVVEDGITSFLKLGDVEKDENFVPNTWRVIDGNVEIAGGFIIK